MMIVINVLVGIACLITGCLPIGPWLRWLNIFFGVYNLLVAMAATYNLFS